MIIVFQKSNFKAGIEWQGCLDKEFGILSAGHAFCFMPTYSSQEVCHSGGVTAGAVKQPALWPEPPLQQPWLYHLQLRHCCSHHPNLKPVFCRHLKLEIVCICRSVYEWVCWRFVLYVCVNTL